MLRKLIGAGMDVARLGLAHGTLEEAMERYNRIRRVADEMGERVGILVDLPGPKIRCAGFPEGGVDIPEGSTVTLVPGTEASNSEVIQIDYDSLLVDIQPGDNLPFGDGQVRVDVRDIGPDGATCLVTTGGRLEGRPGLNIPSERVSLSTPTDEDLRLLDHFVEAGVDMVAVSFVRSAHDIRRVGTEPYPRGPLIVAKIETQAAVENLEGIIEASNAIMVARGDLGLECPIEELPHLQKRIIRECIAGGLPAITATQMLDSMITNQAPTRAEASDVANAVFDGTSVVMLSGETAIGDHPVRAVEVMAAIAQRADEEFDHQGWTRRIAELSMTKGGDDGQAVTDAITLATWRAANQLDVKALVCISASGYTVRSMARFRPQAPILGMSTDERTVQQLTLSWGVTPLQIDPEWSYEFRVNKAIEVAKKENLVRSGDLVGVVAGMIGGAAATDTLRLMKVP